MADVDDFIQRQRAASFGANNLSRNLGSDQTIRKPDGSPIFSTPSFGVQDFNNNASTSQTPGIFSNFMGAAQPAVQPDRATADIVELQKDKEKSLQGVTVTAQLNVPNPLENFASYNVLWTMACLTPQQYNNPSLYRNDISQLKNIVFSSAGRFDSQRVSTAYGTPEFYINNFKMTCIVSSNKKTGNQNAIEFNFDIYEPYSMGLLLQSMQRSARLAGFANYLETAPYVLRMDIQGFDELGNVIKSVLPKFFTMKLTECTFQVNEGGSVYKVTAVPLNHMGYSDMVNIAYKDIKIGGDPKGDGDVKELLITGKNSLMNTLNRIEQKLKADGLVGEADEFVIQFPSDASIMYSSQGSPPAVNRATSSPSAEPPKVVKNGSASDLSSYSGPINEIGLSTLGFDQSSGGTIGFARASEQYDPKTGIKKIDNMIFNAKERVFQFAQKQSITSIITQVIMSSKYIHEAYKNKTKEGFIKWFKIDVQMEFLKEDPLTLDFARRFIYRVVPYYVHESIFTETTQNPTGYKELAKKIVKYYDYIYTGQNVDILKFDIKIDNQFYQGALSAPAKDNAKVNNPDQQATASKPQQDLTRKQGSSDDAKTTEAGRARKRRSPDSLQRVAGGSGFRSSEQEIAEDFQRAFIGRGSADLIEVNLEILGDTYWLVDSGYGNYFSRVSDAKSQITNDGAMNYEAGDIYVYLTFRTPADIDESTGLYDFNGNFKESPFGGIYRVVQVDNVFSEGVWKQNLQLLRMPGPQGPEELAAMTQDRTRSEAPGYESAGIEAEKTVVADDVTREEPTKNVEGLTFTI